ncbi:dipeptidyl peptidase 3 isoform X2 [Aethina tumida]|nr:dipeptidyl peptidase 3 isoform X2 [Aethina tumida]
MEIDKSQFVLPNEQPVVALEVQSAFSCLTDKEKMYAHYLSKASWVGGLITLLQTSPESGPIFVMLHKLFSAQSPNDFKQLALSNGFSEDEITALFVYAAGVFSNSGNYKGFGDTKFIPNLEKDRMEGLLKLSANWSELESLWNEYKDRIYHLSKDTLSLGYNNQGLTTYLSKNVTPEDNEKVIKWLKDQNMEAYNTRLFKTEVNGQTCYEIRQAAEKIAEMKVATIDNIIYKLTSGDYSPLLGRVAYHLNQAKKYCDNDTEYEMLTHYSQSFKNGSLADHKTGSKYWIEDKSPAIETYIGFIETYRDPAGSRGEFEGFVAAVNREMSAKFSVLVSKAENFLTLLPWPRQYEKDAFLKPDFTSLDVITFAGSGIPAGINIPNYDDIRQTIGFKNVSLGNVIPASYQMSQTPFLSEEDAEVLRKWRVPAFELQVGLHELLGHGSGKLFFKQRNGSCNFPEDVIDPTTGKAPASWYETGDTFDACFGPLSSTYEECRAEAVGLYLSLNEDVLKIFGHEGEQAEDVIYANWLSLVYAGAGRAMELYEPGRGWLQAHAQARFVLARVLIEAGVAQITQPKEDDILVSLDRSKLKTVGKKAIGDFLLKLQIFKSTANVKAARELYNEYADVPEFWLKLRSIVLAHKQPRKMFVQPNTILANETVELKVYEPTLEGLLQSWVDRFQQPSLYENLIDLTNKDRDHFK